MAKSKKRKYSRMAELKMTQEYKNIRKILLDDEIYLICVDDKGTPLITEAGCLFYSDKAFAERDAQSFEKIYGEGKIHIFKIEDNMSFYEMMWDCGLQSFILNGNSKIYHLNEFFKFMGEPQNVIKRNEIIQNQIKVKGAFLKKRIVIKKWFSTWANVSIICGLLCSIIVFVFPLIFGSELSRYILPGDVVCRILQLDL